MFGAFAVNETSNIEKREINLTEKSRIVGAEIPFAVHREITVPFFENRENGYKFQRDVKRAESNCEGFI